MVHGSEWSSQMPWLCYLHAEVELAHIIVLQHGLVAVVRRVMRRHPVETAARWEAPASLKARLLERVTDRGAQRDSGAQRAKRTPKEMAVCETKETMGHTKLTVEVKDFVDRVHSKVPVRLPHKEACTACHAANLL
eukprot:gene75-biopygen247